MGFDDLKGKATDALGNNSDKVEEHSDQGLDKAGEFAEGKGASSEHVDKGKDFLDGKIGE
ncbi:Rv0909 family putative TA system antitoxin [Janibacter sp. RAF20_2_2]|uniref:Antitoxin n=1 Tax=Janibacter hoylei PVAS-1 TaxID=1210046 RepID=A0A444BB52_9MICO|nr:Rv0909 family putative TA system antitoxin [Janibacter hoylei]MCW4600798.1 Rv0909 family putative TA system antitoxin [Janibacter hoylei]RWU85580.1 hypothetical protein CWN80_00910 [Janibacter hoylei PVAS-1]